MQSVIELGFPWRTFDPFLFCVHHDDAYPAGNEEMGPATSLAGRNIGMDFEAKDGWRMYHGDVVPGFPRHPHRGFETVTLARSGFIDHSDSLGATARFGNGDAQWMTAGKGIVHAEMFPLVSQSEPNPCELFQIWLNLPAADKMVDPHFTMLWSERIPKLVFEDGAGRKTQLALVAGKLGEQVAPPPPPSSWASRPQAEIAIWTLKMEPGAQWELPAASPGLNRTLYFFAGEALSIGGQSILPYRGARLRSDQAAPLQNGDTPTEALLLQGRPIAEPIAHYGPFVMNEPRQLEQAMLDYRRTQFGGWPWKSDGPVHTRQEGRFAIHADGKRERPESPQD